MGTHGMFLKSLFGILMFVGFTMFLLVGILESGESETKTQSYFGPAGSLKRMKVIEEENQKFGVGPKSDLNYMSKRRVPNGPDPIHNRRAGNSGRPPGQA